MEKQKHLCLRCGVADAYQTKSFLSAYCASCHKEKFGFTHEEANDMRGLMEDFVKHFKVDIK